MTAFKIKAVNPQTREFTGKFGTMKSYQVMFEGVPQAVEISQKVETPAPVVGQVLDGSIDMSGSHGPKFKKEYNQGGGFGGGQHASSGGAPSRGGFRNDDPFTMYLSYSKDIVVALINQAILPSEEAFKPLFQQALSYALAGGKELYSKRPGAETNAPAAPPAADDWASLAAKADSQPAPDPEQATLGDIFGGVDITEGESPWNPGSK